MIMNNQTNTMPRVGMVVPYFHKGEDRQVFSKFVPTVQANFERANRGSVSALFDTVVSAGYAYLYQRVRASTAHVLTNFIDERIVGEFRGSMHARIKMLPRHEVTIRHMGRRVVRIRDADIPRAQPTYCTCGATCTCHEHRRSLEARVRGSLPDGHKLSFCVLEPPTLLNLSTAAEYIAGTDRQVGYVVAFTPKEPIGKFCGAYYTTRKGRVFIEHKASHGVVEGINMSKLLNSGAYKHGLYIDTLPFYGVEDMTIIRLTYIQKLKYVKPVITIDGVIADNALDLKTANKIMNKAGNRVIDPDNVMTLANQGYLNNKGSGGLGSLSKIFDAVKAGVNNGIKSRKKLLSQKFIVEKNLHNELLDFRRPGCSRMCRVIAALFCLTGLTMIIFLTWTPIMAVFTSATKTFSSTAVWIGSTAVTAVVASVFILMAVLVYQFGPAVLQYLLLVLMATGAHAESFYMHVTNDEDITMRHDVYLSDTDLNYGGVVEWLTHGTLFIIGITVYIWLIVRGYRCVERWNERRFIKRLKQVIRTERRTTEFVRDVVTEPFSLTDIETNVDPDKYPQNSQAKLKLEWRYAPRKRRGNGVTAVGTVFTFLMPAVFSTSRHNLHVGVLTRATIRPPDRVTGDFWKEPLSLPMVSDGLPKPLCIQFTIRGITKCWKRPTMKVYLSRFPAPKRKRFVETLRKLECGDYHRKNFVYNCFIKREKQLLYSLVEYEPTRPRVITGASWPAKAFTGLWFYSYGIALKFAWNPVSWFKTTHGGYSLWYCSGYTTPVFNAWADHWIGHFGGLNKVTFLYSDFSKFDVTQAEQCINRETEWYKTLGIIRDLGKKAKWVLDMKRNGMVYGDEISYSTPGGRKSGDNDTSSGNTVTTGTTISYVLNTLGLSFASAVLGDDNITVLPRLDHDIGPLIIKMMSTMGLTVKVRQTNKIMEAEFLSCKFYPTENGFKLGKKPARCCAKLGWMLTKAGRKHADYLPLFKGTLRSYFATAMHVPFLRVYIQEWYKKLNNVSLENSPDNKWIIGHGEDVIFHADSLTWKHFTDFYQVDESQEEEFRRQLIRTITPGKVNVVGSDTLRGMYALECLV